MLWGSIRRQLTAVRRRELLSRVGALAWLLSTSGCGAATAAPEPSEPSDETPAGTDIACPSTAPEGRACAPNEQSPNDEYCYYPREGGEDVCRCDGDTWRCHEAPTAG